ncbi:hypothetical protein OH687_07925 [Burkholderia anthina]|nr:hypothetical protein OH687_07925 [Burkholderia anthina]
MSPVRGDRPARRAHVRPGSMSTAVPVTSMRGKSIHATECSGRPRAETCELNRPRLRWRNFQSQNYRWRAEDGAG